MNGFVKKIILGNVGLGLIFASGCQTWFPEAGLTLPTGDYLKHAPQYIPPSPPFPLPKELASIEEAQQQQQQAPAPGLQGR